MEESVLVRATKNKISQNICYLKMRKLCEIEFILFSSL